MELSRSTVGFGHHVLGQLEVLSGDGAAAGDEIVGASASGLSTLCWGKDGEIFGCGPQLPPNPATLQKVTLVACGGRHALAVAGRKLYGWGCNDFGQLGRGTSGGGHFDVGLVALGVCVGPISAGEEHSLALCDGLLFSWGRADFGQLGRSAGAGEQFCSKPLAVDAVRQVAGLLTQIAAGSHHCAVLNQSGRVTTFGFDLYHQCGHSGTIGGGTSCSKPLHVTALDEVGELSPSTGEWTGVAQIACGWWHTACVATNGDLYTWGWNEHGQLGHAPSPNPGLVTGALDERRVSCVACGSRQTVALTTDGEIYAFGTLWFGDSSTTIGSLLNVDGAGKDTMPSGWSKVLQPRRLIRVPRRSGSVSRAGNNDDTALRGLACGRWHGLAW